MHVLVIEDEPTQLLMIQKMCESFGFQVSQAQNGEEALFMLKDAAPELYDIVLTDLMMPIADGREVIRGLRQKHPHIPAIVITSESSEAIASELKELGAQDFLTKPITKERLKVSIDNALQLTDLQRQVERLHQRDQRAFGFDDLICAYSGLSGCVNTARKYARSDMPVLLTGESGVGKEVFARAIHGESTRADMPFIAINCGAIPANLVESTLFGHEKGAFTGAVSKSLGKFREAQGGTLFLDEIGELPLDIQVKLLRALQQSEVEPVGLGASVQLDVRILSATNRDLQEAVDAGNFRSDLFFRLAVLPLELPPLRERPQDIPDLCHHFLQRICAKERLPAKRLSDEALQWAIQHPWPGNVRELENTLSRAALLAENDTLRRSDVEPSAATAKSETHTPPAQEARTAAVTSSAFSHPSGQPKTLEEVTLELVTDRLAQLDHHVGHAADSLGIPASTLYRKLREWKQEGKIADAP